MPPVPAQLDWVDAFVARIRPYVHVRLTDRVLIRLPNQAFKLNRTGARVLHHIIHGGSINNILEARLSTIHLFGARYWLLADFAALFDRNLQESLLTPDRRILSSRYRFIVDVDSGSYFIISHAGADVETSSFESSFDAEYDEDIEIDLSELEPLISQPSSPDNVVKVREIEGTPVVQVCVGSCTNSSYEDLMTVAAILKGKSIHPDVSFTVTPGSKQVYSMIA